MFTEVVALIYNLGWILVAGVVKIWRWVWRGVEGRWEGWAEKWVKMEGQRLGVILEEERNFGGEMEVMKELWRREEEDRRVGKEGEWGRVVRIGFRGRRVLGRVAFWGVQEAFEGYVRGQWRVGRDEEEIVEVVRRVMETGGWRKGWGRRWRRRWRERKWEAGVEGIFGGDLRLVSGGGPGCGWSCGRWKGVKEVRKAQREKMEGVGRLLGVKEGMKVAILGGWGFGGYGKFFRERFGVEVVEVVESEEEAEVIRNYLEGEGMEVTVVVGGMHAIQGTFDRVIIPEFRMGKKGLKLLFQVA